MRTENDLIWEAYVNKTDADNLEHFLFLLFKVENINKLNRDFLRLHVQNEISNLPEYVYYVFNRLPSEIGIGRGKSYDELSLLSTDSPLSFSEQTNIQCVAVSDKAILQTSNELFKHGLEIENNNHRYLITRDFRKQNRIRVTELDSDETPTGHIHIDSDWFSSDIRKLVGGRVFVFED